jgi:DNA polymerase eta
MGIGAFLVKGDEAKALITGLREAGVTETGSERPDKRRRIGTSSGIQRFFTKTDSPDEHDDDFGAQNLTDNVPLADGDEANRGSATSLPALHEATKTYDESPFPVGIPALYQGRVTDYMCDRCEGAFDSADGLQSHQDWHFAKDLQDEDRGRAGQSTSPALPATSKKPVGNMSKKKAGRGKPEKGQSKLAFG